VSLGLGAGSKGGTGGILILTGRLGLNLVTLRISGSEDASVLASEPVIDYAVLYGRRLSTTPDWMLVSGSAGVGVVRNVTENSFTGPDVSETTVGLPFQLQVAAHTPYAVGLGVTAFANVNPARPFFGLAVGGYLGDLR